MSRFARCAILALALLLSGFLLPWGVLAAPQTPIPPPGAQTRPHTPSRTPTPSPAGARTVQMPDKVHHLKGLYTGKLTGKRPTLQQLKARATAAAPAPTTRTVTDPTKDPSQPVTFSCSIGGWSEITYNPPSFDFGIVRSLTHTDCSDAAGAAFPMATIVTDVNLQNLDSGQGSGTLTLMCNGCATLGEAPGDYTGYVAWDAGESFMVPRDAQWVAPDGYVFYYAEAGCIISPDQTSAGCVSAPALTPYQTTTRGGNCPGGQSWSANPSGFQSGLATFSGAMSLEQDPQGRAFVSVNETLDWTNLTTRTIGPPLIRIIPIDPAPNLVSWVDNVQTGVGDVVASVGVLVKLSDDTSCRWTASTAVFIP